MFLKFKVCLIYKVYHYCSRTCHTYFLTGKCYSFTFRLCAYLHESEFYHVHYTRLSYSLPIFCLFFNLFLTLIIHFLSVILPNLFQRYTCISMRSDVKRGNCTLSQANDCHSTQTFLYNLQKQ